MTAILVNNESRTGNRLLKNAGKYPHGVTTEGNSFEQFKKDFDKDCINGLTPQQFMTEMEQRIKKW